MANSPIPVKNLFYMLCYAWDVLAIQKNSLKLAEDDYGDAYNLLARVFSFGIGKLIRSGFHHSYLEKSEELTTLRGKISVQDSVRKLSMLRQKLVCEFDEYSTDDDFNRMLKYTMEELIKNRHIDQDIRKQLYNQIVFFREIDKLEPTRQNRKKLHFNRNNVIYKLLISIAAMIHDNTVISEETGRHEFNDFFREQQMHTVFEKFLLNFYDTHLRNKGYRVHAPAVSWPIDDSDPDAWTDAEFELDDNPGNRRTDIVVENKARKLQMIFDAKYYEKMFVNRYWTDEEVNIRTSHLNQVRGYLLDSKYEGQKVGALLYPVVESEIKKGKVFRIKGTPIIIKTVNLNCKWQDIEVDLLDFVERIEKVYVKA